MKLVKIKKELFMYLFGDITVKNCRGICGGFCDNCVQLDICNRSDYVIREFYETD